MGLYYGSSYAPAHKASMSFEFARNVEESLYAINSRGA